MSRTDAPRPSRIAEWGDRVPRSLGRMTARQIVVTIVADDMAALNVAMDQVLRDVDGEVVSAHGNFDQRVGFGYSVLTVPRD